MAKKVDPVNIQFSVRARLPKGLKMTQKLQERILLEWAETGKLPKGFEIRMIKWRNPARKPPKNNWRVAESKADIEEARITLRLKELLPVTHIEFF